MLLYTPFIFKRATSIAADVIFYTMDNFSVLGDGTLVAVNDGSYGATNNGLMYGGCQVHLDGITQSVPYKIENQVLADVIINGDFPINIDSWVDNGTQGTFWNNGVMQSDGVSSLRKYQDITVPIGLVHLTWDSASINGASLKIYVYEGHAFTTQITNILSVEGGNSLYFSTTTGLVRVYLFESSISDEQTIDNIIANPITTTNSHISYYDVATKQRLQIDMASTPSQTHSMTTSHSSFVSATRALTVAELAQELTIPNMMDKVWFDGLVLVDGFSASDIVHYYGGDEGVVGAENVYDVVTPLGVQQLLNNEFTTDLSNWVISLGSWWWDNGVARNSDGSSGYMYQAITLPNATWRLKFDCLDRVGFGADLTGAYLYVKIWSSGASSVYSLPDPLLSNIELWHTGDVTKVEFKVVNGTPTCSLDNIALEEVEVSKIINFTTPVRTNLLNTNVGSNSNLLVKQDASGRTIGMADVGTTQWVADGRNIDSQQTLVAPYTVTEELDLDTYTFTSDGNRYLNTVPDGTFTPPTGVWKMSDNLAFDGVTTVTSRGNTSVIDAVVIP